MDSKKINQLGTEVDPQQSDLTVIGDPISGQLKKITWLQVAHLIGAQASVTLQQVTDSGNTTTDPIITGGLTLSNLGTGLPRLTSGEFVGTYGYGLANGVATLDSGGKIPASQLPSSVMEYKGTWNASTNTPTLADGTGDNGDVYLVNVAGSQNLGSGTISFAVGDWVVYNGTIWQKSLNSNAVASVFGRTGTIVAQEGDYNIDQLGDVAITSAATNDYLRYNGSLWVNTPFPTFVSSDKLVLQVRNNSGATINKGTVVYINGATAGYPTIAKAQADADATSAQTIGVVQDNISNNSNGIVVLVGQISGVDTSAYAAGTQLYLSGTTAGAYTSTKALAPTHLVYVGVVTAQNAVNGVIEVKIQNGYELEEIHDVAISSVANNEGLFYESSSSLWKNKSIATILGGTPIIGSGTNTEMAYFSPNGNTLTSSPFFYITDVGTKKALTFKALYNYITTEDNIIGGVTNPDLNLVISGDDNILFKVTNASVTAAKIKDGGDVEFYYNLNVTEKVKSKEVLIDGAAGTYRPLTFTTNGSNRWVFYTTNSPETGSNNGSDLVIVKVLDDGLTADVAFGMNRATGDAKFYYKLQILDIPALSTASNTFLVSDSGNIKYRTAANVLSDIAALPLAGGTLTGALTISTSLQNSFTLNSSHASLNQIYFNKSGTNYGKVYLYYDSINTRYEMVIGTYESTGRVRFESGNNTTALTLNADQSATFVGGATFGGNVGIGAAPSTTLHLTNGTEANIRITSEGSGGDQGAIYVQKSTGNGLTFAVENRDFIWRTGSAALTGGGGSDRMRLTNGGNLLLGIGSNTWDAAETRAIELGTTGNAISGYIGSSVLYITTNAYLSSGWKYSRSSVASGLIDMGGGAFRFKNAASGTAGNAITWSEPFIIAANGQTTIKSTTFTSAIFNSTYGQSDINIQNSGISFAVFGSGISVCTTAAADDVGIGTAGLAKNIVFATGTSFTERTRISSDGYLRLAGKGIQFNGDTADANSLDDYEEGTWTPAITYDSGTSGVTYSGRAGKYTKIGRVVHIEFVIGLSSKGTGSNDVTITGLPFTVANDMASGEPACVNISYVSGLSTSVYFLNGWANNNSTLIQLRKQTSSTTTMGQSYVLIGDISDTLYIQGCCTYHV